MFSSYVYGLQFCVLHIYDILYTGSFAIRSCIYVYILVCIYRHLFFSHIIGTLCLLGCWAFTIVVKRAICNIVYFCVVIGAYSIYPYRCDVFGK